MHSYIEIISTYRRSDGLSTILDRPNILICQSAAINNAPSDQLPGPIYGILPGYSILYATQTSSPTSTSAVCQRHNHCEHSVDVSISHPLCCQVSDTRTFINIYISALTAVSELILFMVFDLIQLALFD